MTTPASPSDVALRRVQDLDELTEFVPTARRRALGSLGPAPEDFALRLNVARYLADLCPRHAYPAADCPGCAVELAMLSEPRP
jgi:hypothetical protein